jgi:ParB family chromosome partitioning protein
MLIIDVDVRAEAWPDRDLVTSIRNSRRLAPVKGLRTPDGRIRVRYGHRRILAAIEAGRETVPVLVHEAEDNRAAGNTVHPTEDRTAQCPSDEIASVGQLSAFGMSAAQIARRTKSARADVDAAILAASSDLAVRAVQRYDFITVAQAAAVAEFDDNKLAVSVLIIVPNAPLHSSARLLRGSTSGGHGSLDYVRSGIGPLAQRSRTRRTPGRCDVSPELDTSGTLQAD